MKNLYARNLSFEFTSQNHKSRISHTLLSFQCNSFDLHGLPNDLKKIHFLIEINGQECSVERISDEKIYIQFRTPYEANLSLFLQIQSILSSKLIVHGAIVSNSRNSEIVTGKGGVGKTFKTLISCFQQGGVFKGDDLLLLDKEKIYPIIRPLCIYPDHVKNEKLKRYLARIKIKRRSVLISKIERKMFLYLDTYITKGSLLAQVTSTTFSSKTFAYVQPTALGLNVDTKPINRCPIKVLPDDSLSKAEGTLSEFRSFGSILDKFVPTGMTFEQYVKSHIE